MTVVPTILAVFANYPDLSPKHLPFLEKELSDLGDLFDILMGRGKLIGKAKDVREKDNLLAIVKRWQVEMRLLHYGGHASTLSLDTQSTRLPVDNFVEYIDLCQKLEVVVLNGCSTSGFVKRLFERTRVKAIVATNYLVRDSACHEFSTEFYDLLLNKELSLETAFIKAISNFSGSFKRDKNIYRLNRKEGVIQGVTALAPLNPGSRTRASEDIDNPLDKEEEPVPWGLYIADEEVLDWKAYVDGSGVESQKAELMEEKNALIKQWLASGAEIEGIKEDIEYHKGSGERGKGRLKASEDELAEAQKKLAEIVDKKEKVIQKISELSNELKEEMIVRRFSESFPELNYETQIKLTYTQMDKKKFRGFILQGTPSCAVNLLAWRLIELLEIRETAVVHYDFESRFITEGWTGLNTQLELKVEDHDPDGIVREMINHYRGKDEPDDTQKGFLLLFRNSKKDDFARNEVRESIVEFWQDLTRRFEEQDGGRSFSHPIYLFVLDDNCSREPGGNEYRSNRQKDYEENVKDDKTIAIYPVVQPLNKQVIRSWQFEKKFPVALILGEEDIDRVLKTTAGNFLPSIQEISGLKITNPSKKKDAYLNFRRSSVDKDFPKLI